MHSVIVLGSGRSGTSMVAGALAASGYFMGERLLPPNESNPKGYFEDSRVNALNERILESVLPRRPPLIGNLLFRERPLSFQRWLAVVPPTVDVLPSDEFGRQIRPLVERQPFCFKDPRFCYTLAAWRPFLGKTRFVCVFRHPAVTAASMLKLWSSDQRLQTMSLSTERALQIWTAMYRHVLEKHSRQGDWLFLHYDQALQPSGLERLAHFLDCTVDSTFPERTLSRSTGTTPIPSEAKLIYERLCAMASFDAET